MAMTREVPPGLGKRPRARGGRAAPPWALGEPPERPTLHLPTRLPYTSQVAYPTPANSPTLHLPSRLPYTCQPTYPAPPSQLAYPTPPNRPTLHRPPNSPTLYLFYSPHDN